MFIETWTDAHPSGQLRYVYRSLPHAGTSSGYSRISSKPTPLTSMLKPRDMIRRATNELASSRDCSSAAPSCTMERTHPDSA